MATDTIVLVITTSPGLGELIQQILTESGLYMVLLTDKPEEALEFAQAMPFTICILDSAIRNYPISELVDQLRTLIPGMRLIVIHSYSYPVESSSAGIVPDSTLPRSFSPAELLKTVTQALLQPITEPIHTEASQINTPIPAPIGGAPELGPTTTKMPEWLEDVNRVAQHLTSLSLETAAQAALIIRNGQLWAYAGQLPQTGAQELAHQLATFWESGTRYPEGIPSKGNRSVGSGDIVRFIHLDSTQGMYMLYATAFSKDMVLALAFDSETPFSKIRRQAWHLARALASPPGTQIPPYADFQSRTTNLTVSEPAELPDELLTIKPFLEDVPPPNPYKISSSNSNLPPQIHAPDWSEVSTLHREEPSSQDQSNLINTPTDITSSETTLGKGLPLEAVPVISEQELESRGSSETKDYELEEPQSLDHIAGEQADLIENELDANMQPAIIPYGQYLTYTCLLLPRMPQHLLSSDLSTRLFEWMGQLCLAFGWQLEHLSIHPDHIQWIAGAPPTTSPAYIIRMLRKHTSVRIFTEFPSLAYENPSGDFWAPGYLIMSGSQNVQAQLVEKYILQIRHKQGVSNQGPDKPR
jgi:REP element-mobilizing transposase RayT/DNA-binding NarL/FixJ family response regulator